ncbi:hypothetical protein HK405_013804, partial [Cladochytrium tenue]
QDAHLFCFLSLYITCVADTDAVADNWPALSGFLRENYLQYVSVKAGQYPSVLRLATSALDKLTSTSFLDDKRLRREADTLLQTICDTCINAAARDLEAAVASAAASTTHGVAAEAPPLDDILHNLSPGPEVVSLDVAHFLADRVVPNIRKLLSDQDKVLALLTNMVYYAVAPAIKSGRIFSSGSSGEADGGADVGVGAGVHSSLRLLHSISKLPFAVRTWKKEAWDVFLDNRFFGVSGAQCALWKVVVQSLMVVEKEARLTDLLGRISAVPSTSLFLTREQEAVGRSYALRRLSFAVWCGSRDQYVPQVPNIQEKLVEVLKGPSGPMHVEAYTCLRVLVLRVASHHLANLWPIILTELIRLFGIYLRDPTSNEELAVFAAACKFLDLLLVLGIEEFQCHQWIFVAETLEEAGGRLDSVQTVSGQQRSLVDRLDALWRPLEKRPEASGNLL